MHSREDAEAAMAAVQGRMLRGRPLEVKWATAPEPDQADLLAYQQTTPLWLRKVCPLPGLACLVACVSPRLLPAQQAFRAPQLPRLGGLTALLLFPGCPSCSAGDVCRGRRRGAPPLRPLPPSWPLRPSPPARPDAARLAGGRARRRFLLAAAGLPPQPLPPAGGVRPRAGAATLFLGLGL